MRRDVRTFHPDDIAREQAHTTRGASGRPPCAHDHDRDAPCNCTPTPDGLAAVWAGRARMAIARRDAGRPLDDADLEALRRQETP